MRPQLGLQLSYLALTVVWGGAATVFVSPEAEARSIPGFEDVANMAHDVVEGLWPDELGVPGLRARVGVGLLNAPAYRGASDNEWNFVPLIFVKYKDIASFTGQKLKVRAYQYEGWSAGGFVRYRFGRSEGEHAVLQGLGKVGDTWEVGPYVEYRTGHTRFTVEVRPALTNRQGITTYVEVATGLYQDENWKVQALAYALWGDKENLRTNFGVSEAQAASSTYGLPVYEPGSGLVEARVAVGGEYRLSDTIHLGQFVSYGRFVDGAASSPIVKAGSNGQLAAGVGVILTF